MLDLEVDAPDSLELAVSLDQAVGLDDRFGAAHPLNLQSFAMPANSLDKLACAGLRLTRRDHLDPTAKLSPHRIVDAE